MSFCVRRGRALGTVGAFLLVAVGLALIFAADNERGSLNRDSKGSMVRGIVYLPDRCS
jgi:hypothetical protein